MEKTDEEYETEIMQINQMFPDALFTIAIDIDRMDEIVSQQPFIIVEHSYDCYCYNRPKKKDNIYVRGDRITNKFIIQKLIDYGLCLECNHHFIEGFEKIRNTSYRYNISIGS